MADDQATMEDLFGSESEEEPQQVAQPASKNAPEGDDSGAANGSAPQEDQMRVFQALFGRDNEDDDNDTGPSKPSSAAAAGEEGDAYYRQPTPEEEEEVLRGPPMRVSVPLHDVLDTDQLRLTKLSNIIAIEPRPFDPKTYEPSGAEYIDERGHKRVRLHDTNAIRWRWTAGADGTPIRESNSRLIRWSDGSVTLNIGDEVMDVREFDISGDHSFLFARHPNLIQGQGPLKKKITLRPASLTSTSHKRLAAAVVKHHGSSRQLRVRATTTVVDPKKKKEDQEKAEAARIKDLEKLADKQQRQLKKYRSTPTSYGGGGGSRNRPTALNARYLEEDEEEEEEEEEDDGFIVRDEDMEPGEGGGAGELEDEDEDDNDEEEDVDIRRLVSRPRARDYEEEREAERRLTTAKNSAPPLAAPAPGGGGGGGVLKDSDDDDEEMGGEKQRDSSTVKSKGRAMLMESDSE
jgi:RNA polymerase-associated protein LEO1